MDMDQKSVTNAISRVVDKLSGSQLESQLLETVQVLLYLNLYAIFIYSTHPWWLECMMGIHVEELLQILSVCLFSITISITIT